MVKTMRRISGAGGGGKGGGGENSPNSLRSGATVRILDLLGEGEIDGLVDGSKSIYFDNTPLMDGNGTFNFKGIKWDERVGLPDQPFVPGFSSVESEEPINIEVKNGDPVLRTISGEDLDAVRLTVTIPALFNVNKKGLQQAHSVEFYFEIRYNGGPWVNPLGTIDVQGKNTAAYDRSFDIKLPRAPTGASSPWTVRMVRVSDDSEDATKEQNSTVFSSMTKITYGKFTYPNSAYMAMTVAVEQFGQSVPQRSYEVNGRIVRVPSNYTPRVYDKKGVIVSDEVYTGVWNGTFKWAWCDNPAWVLYDIVTNDRFGLGENVDEQQLDKWALYPIAQYSDGRVSDGKGGMQPRFTFNAWITTQEEAFNALATVASCFRGMAFWSSGSVTASQDRPQDVSILANQTNVIEGSFSYQSSALKARHTVAIVKWYNPELNYEQDYVVVEDPIGIQLYGYRETEIEGVGITNRGQAARLGEWTLFTELNEVQVCSYTAGLDHAGIRPGDIVAVADPNIMGSGDFGGRLSTGSTKTSIKIDRPVTFVSGKTYAMMLMLPNGQVEERNIAVSAYGEPTNTVTVATGFTVTPEAETVWVIASNTLVPSLWKVISIREATSSTYEVSAAQHEPSKFAVIDEGARFDPLPVNAEIVVQPPKNLQVTENLYSQNGSAKNGILLSWSAPGPEFVAVSYDVSYDGPEGYVTVGRIPSMSVTITEPAAGEYTFYVASVGFNGRVSQPASVQHTTAGWEGNTKGRVTNLTLHGKTPNITMFDTANAEFEWDNLWEGQELDPKEASPVYRDNVVRVYESVSGDLLRTDYVKGASYVYTLGMNQADNLALGRTAQRNLRIEVSLRDIFGVVSTPAILSVSNPPPAKINPIVTGMGGPVYVNYPQSPETDLSGYLIWVSETQNFNPNTTQPSYTGLSTVVSFPLETNKTYYVRVAAFDVFGRSGLNISDEITIVNSPVEFDFSPPANPTGLAATTALLPDGRARTTFTWAANVEDDLALYAFDIKEGAGGFVSYLLGSATFVADTQPNVVLSARVAATDKWDNKSGYSPLFTITTAKDSTPPAVPTGFEVTGTFGGFWLEWVANTESDLASYEVYESDTSTEPTMETGATFRYFNTSNSRTGLDPNVTRYYWLRAVDTSGNRSAWTARKDGTTNTLDGSIPAPAIPDAPTLTSIVVVENGDTLARITATWPEVANAVTYEMGIQAGSGAEVFQASGGQNTFTFDGFPGIEYKVRVRAIGSFYNKSWYSPVSSITPIGDTIPPAVPTGVKVSVGFQTVWLEYAGGQENDFRFFEIYESKSPTAPSGATVATFRSTTTTVPRTGLDAGTTYHYWVRAVDTSSNHSAWSETVSADIPNIDGTQPKPAAPVAPTLTSKLVAQNGGGFVAQVRVEWPAVDKAVGYEIGVVRDGFSESFTTSGTNDVTFDGVPGVTYSVRVRSIGNVGQKSDFGAVASLTPAGDTVAPATPANLTANGSFQSTRLTWSAVSASDLSHYEVFASQSQTTPAANVTPTYTTASTILSISAMPDGVETTYWVRSADYSGNKSAWSAPATTETLPLTGTQPAAAAPAAPELTSTLIALAGGGFTVKVRATWPAVANATSYEVAVTRAGASETIIPSPSNQVEFDAVPGLAYAVAVRSVNRVGVRSVWGTATALAAQRDTTAPAAASIAAYSFGFQNALLKFTPVNDADFAMYEVYQSTTNTAPSTEAAPTYQTANDNLSIISLAEGTTYYFWVRSRDTSGNKSAWSSVTSGQTVKLVAGNIAGIVDQTSVAASIIVPSRGTALPATPFTADTPKQYFLTTNNTMYSQKDDGSGWVPTRDASLIVGKLIADQIGASAIGTDQLKAGAVIASKLAIGDFTNMADRGWTVGERDGWDMSDYFSAWYLETNAENPMGGEWTLRSTGRHPAITNYYTVTPGDSYYFDVWVYNTDPGRASILFNTQERNGVDTWQLAAYTDVKSEWTRMTGLLKVPPGGTKARMSLFSDHVAGQGQFTYWARPVMRKATGTVMIENGAVTADKVTTGELITLQAQIKSATINTGHIIDLTADKIRAGTAFANSLTIDGTTLGTVRSNAALGAQDPASRINAAVTRIDPGKIVVSGATTLADWRHGTDTTTIDGGKVFAGSITTYQLAVLNGPNLIEDSLFRANFDYWDIAPNFPANAGFTSYLVEAGTSWASPTGRSMALRQISGSVGGNFFTDVRLRRNEPGLPGVGTNSVPVKVGEWIEAHVGFSFHRCYGELRLEWRDVSGNVIAYSDGGQFTGGDMGNSSNAEQWPRWRVKGQAPNNAGSVGIHIRKLDTYAGQTDSYVFVYKPMLCRVSQQTTEMTPWSDGAVTRITGNQINTGVVKAVHVDVTDLVVSGLANINVAYIKEANISGTLNATKITAGTALASSLTIDGSTLGTVRYNAEVGALDPANRINNASTRVDPGRILISGATSLADWRGTSDTTLINGGKIQTDSIDVRSVRVGNFTNLVDFGWSTGYLGSWTPDIVHAFYLEGQGGAHGGGWVLRTDGTNVVSPFITVVPGEYFGGSVWFYNQTVHRAVYYIQWFNATKEYIRSDFLDFSDVKNSWTKMGGNIRQAPTNAVYVRAHLHIEGYTPGVFVHWNKPSFYKAYAGELIVDGTIQARHLITTSAVITGTAQIAEAIITSGKIVSLNADKIEAGSVISNFVRVAGSTGQDLGNIQAWATDPASRINGLFTQIDPGKIVISGGTSLANWRGQSDTTKIFGGSIEANTVSARQLNIGMGSNMLENSDFAAGLTGWRMDVSGPGVWWEVNLKGTSEWILNSQAAVHVWSNNQGHFGNVLPINKQDGSHKRFPVIPGRRYEGSAFTAAHRCDVWAIFAYYDVNGTHIADHVGVPNSQNKTGGKSLNDYMQTFLISTAPAGAASVLPYIRKGGTWAGQGDSHMWATNFFFAEAMEGQMLPSPWNNTGLTIIDGGNIKTGAIDAGHLRTDTAVISGTAQIADGIITNAKIQNLNADKINAGTVLSNFIKIAGSTGQDLGNVQAWATDPANRINGISTQIDPGRILISGGTSLASWRSGSDTSKIEGGQISANSVSANTMKIGSRALTIIGFDFRVINNVLTWDAGYVNYTGDDGQRKEITVAAGAVGWGGWTGVYFLKDYGQSLHIRNDSNGGWHNLSNNQDCVLFCTWWGGANINVNYGGTIIDGGRITANSVTATQINVANLSALNIKVTNLDILDATINGEKLVNGAISAVYFNKSTAFITKSQDNYVLSRDLYLAPYERILINVDWNIRGATPGVNAEVFYGGTAAIYIAQDTIGTTRITGPATDGYTCSNQSISAVWTNGPNEGYFAIQFIITLGSGGAMRTNNPNMGYFGSSNGFSSDGVSWVIMRLKK